MAKKTATKTAAKSNSKASAKAAPKKTSQKPVKSSAKKEVKPASKSAAKAPVKAAVKSPAKPPVKAQAKTAAKVPAAVEKVAPTTMSKKAKQVELEESDMVVEKTTTKTQTIVSLIESDEPSQEEVAKVEKVSKVKPVKVERGNLADEKAKWVELNRKYGKDKCVVYKMSEKYEALVPIQHKVLGWGFILSNENDRLEVLFETGIRMLISNYKS